jgi:hypothetical protein
VPRRPVHRLALSPGGASGAAARRRCRPPRTAAAASSATSSRPRSSATSPASSTGPRDGAGSVGGGRRAMIGTTVGALRLVAVAFPTCGLKAAHGSATPTRRQDFPFIIPAGAAAVVGRRAQSMAPICRRRDRNGAMHCALRWPHRSSSRSPPSSSRPKSTPASTSAGTQGRQGQASPAAPRSRIAAHVASGMTRKEGAARQSLLAAGRALHSRPIVHAFPACGLKAAGGSATPARRQRQLRLAATGPLLRHPGRSSGSGRAQGAIDGADWPASRPERRNALRPTVRRGGAGCDSAAYRADRRRPLHPRPRRDGSDTPVPIVHAFPACVVKGAGGSATAARRWRRRQQKGRLA